MNKEANLMDCSQFQKIVHDLERPGTEGFTLRESALAHAESCSHCAPLMTGAESLDAALRALAASNGEQQAPPRVGIALIEEFRRQRAASSRRRVQRQIAALSAAAAILLVLSFSLYRRTTSGPGVAPVTNVAEKISAPPVASPTVVPEASPVVAPAESLQQNQILASQSEDSAYATTFVPLPYADDPSALDDGAVVRVEMPRAALASFGLPVAAMESDGTVRADLIVSADGTPQAIRLVSQDNSSRSF
jgi:hypothetical protein